MEKLPRKIILLVLVAFSLVTLPALFTTSSAQSSSYLRFKVECNGSPDYNAIVYLIYDGYQIAVSRTPANGTVTWPVSPNTPNYSYSFYYKGYQAPITSINKTAPPNHTETLRLDRC
jgi:hypothetical protein